jgi:hypothetical protein
MQPLYANTWTFVIADAFPYVEQALAAGRKWDVVSVDPYEGEALQVAGMFDKFVRLTKAGGLVVVGRPRTEHDQAFSWFEHPPPVPAGWQETRRSPIWSWFWKIV